MASFLRLLVSDGDGEDDDDSVDDEVRYKQWINTDRCALKDVTERGDVCFKSLSRQIADLTKLGLGIDHRNLMCLYRSLVLSRLLYGFEVFCFSNNQLRPAEVAQNGAMRVVTGCTRDTSISALRYMLQLPTVAQQHQLNQLSSISSTRHLGVSKALQRPVHPLHDIVCCFTDRAPRKRLIRTSWVRSACESLRGIRGRHSLRHDDGWVPVSQEVLHSWRFLVHHLGAECRDWPSGEANAEIERLLDELGANRPDSVVVATDGSVSRVPFADWLGCSPKD